jgi:hypothetical protein
MDQRHQQQQQGQQQHHHPMQTGIGGAVANSNSAAGGMMMGDANANAPLPGPGGADMAPRKEIYTYTAPWTVFAMAWSRRCVIVFGLHVLHVFSDVCNQCWVWRLFCSVYLEILFVVRPLTVVRRQH